ncbi:hypothetical protein HMPREF9443_01128 [Phascolarctobacterium succinatutens YIT 12067]|uniref:Uncharacterized protein n=2 Tax=Phascolarctobacterium succinatutens TaxID=626940 RepID=E8LE57_9FIRM|nr:hypothetical protein HMPREF9443_01128 [Phascolarctobacterium succinatutens YIT 12067]
MQKATVSRAFAKRAPFLLLLSGTKEVYQKDEEKHVIFLSTFQNLKNIPKIPPPPTRNHPFGWGAFTLFRLHYSCKQSAVKQAAGSGGIDMLKESWKNILLGALLLTGLTMLLGSDSSDKKADSLLAMPKAEAAAMPAYEQEYMKIVEGVCDYLTTGNTAGLPAQGLIGFEELEGHNDPGQGVSSVGYTLQDINNDKVPELIFGLIDYPEGKGYYGRDIYAVYTFVDGKIKFVDEGWSRSRLRLLPQDMLSKRTCIDDNDMEWMLEMKDLLRDGSLRQGQTFYTKVEDGRCNVYRKYLDLNDTFVTQKTSMHFDDMMNIDLGAQKLELLPLAEYSSRGFKGLVMQHLNCMGLHELQDNRVDLSAYEHVYVDNPSQGAEVLFSSNTSLASFEVLDLQSDSSRVIYSKGLLKPEEKLVLHLESFETDPELDYENVIKNGICFRDDTGSLRKFAIRAKVMDGSVYLEEID